MNISLALQLCWHVNPFQPPTARWCVLTLVFIQKARERDGRLYSFEKQKSLDHLQCDINRKGLQFWGLRGSRTLLCFTVSTTCHHLASIDFEHVNFHMFQIELLICPLKFGFFEFSHLGNTNYLVLIFKPETLQISWVIYCLLQSTWDLWITPFYALFQICSDSGYFLPPYGWHSYPNHPSFVSWIIAIT